MSHCTSETQSSTLARSLHALPGCIPHGKATNVIKGMVRNNGVIGVMESINVWQGCNLQQLSHTIWQSDLVLHCKHLAFFAI